MASSARLATMQDFPEEWIEGMDYGAYSRRQTETMGRVDRDENSLWRSVVSQRYAINTLYLNGTLTAAALVGELHDLWFSYYVAGRYISADSPAQDRLVIRLLQTQRVGPLARNISPATVDEVVQTEDGVLWVNLPFFAKDMCELWMVNCPAMAPDERANLSSFLAKAASVGICGDKLYSIALVVLRDTLELLRPCDGDEGDQGSGEGRSERTMADVTVTDLMPSACAWLEGAGGRIVQLAEVGWHDCAEDTAAPGSLFIENEGETIGTPSSGFSAARWMFWFRRLGAIQSERSMAERADFQDLVTRTKGFMAKHVREMSTPRVRAIFEASDVTV